MAEAPRFQELVIWKKGKAPGLFLGMKRLIIW